MKVRLRLDGREHDVHLQQTDDGWTADVDGTHVEIQLQDEDGARTVSSGSDAVHARYDGDRLTLDGHTADFRILALEGVAGANGASGGDGAVRPPMTGKVVRVDVAVGDEVEAGTILFVLEAMKMQNDVRSPFAGTVVEVGAAEGEAVETDRVVVRLAAE